MALAKMSWVVTMQQWEQAARGIVVAPAVHTVKCQSCVIFLTNVASEVRSLLQITAKPGMSGLLILGIDIGVVLGK